MAIAYVNIDVKTSEFTCEIGLECALNRRAGDNVGAQKKKTQELIIPKRI